MSSILIKQIMLNKYPSFKKIHTFNINVYANIIQTVLLLNQEITVLQIRNAQSVMNTIREELELYYVKTEIEKIEWITEENTWDPLKPLKFRKLTSDEKTSFARILKNDIIKLFSCMECVMQQKQYSVELMKKLKFTKREYQKVKLLTAPY